jgi:hypothetical protein
VLVLLEVKLQLLGRSPRRTPGEARAASTDMRIRIWKIDEAKVKKVINGHTKGITSLAFKDMM